LSDLFEKHSVYRELMTMPFTYYHIWTYPAVETKWQDGFDEAEDKALYDELRNFAAYLLAKYSGTGKQFYLGHWEGDWYLSGATDPMVVVNLLYLMRQVRIAMGRESQRVQLVWLVTDQGDIDPEIAKAYDQEVAGFTFVKMPKDAAKRNEVEKWLELDGKKSAIHLLDPRADRMMRFDTDKEVPDFKRVSKDLGKLLKWNATGKAK
jgi:hypothetical protein